MRQDIQWSGEWEVKAVGRSLPGILFADSTCNKVYLLLTWTCDNCDQFDDRTMMRRRIPLVHGKTQRDEDVTLVNCEMWATKYYPARGKYHAEIKIVADYAFVDLNVKDESQLLLKGVDVDYGEIVGWTRACAYEEVDTAECGYVYTWRSVRGREIPLREGAIVSFGCGASHPGLYVVQKDLVQRQRINAQFIYDTPQRWQDIMDDVVAVRYLIEFCTGNHVAIEDAEIRLPEEHWASRIVKIENGYKVLFGRQGWAPTKCPDLSDYVLVAPDLQKHASARPKEWYEAFKGTKTLLALYSEIVNDTRGDAVQMLVKIVQTLECAHSYLFGDSTEKFKDRLYDCTGRDETKVSAIIDSAFGPRVFNQMNLRARLFELYMPKNFFDFTPEKIARLADFCKKAAKTRHYCAHHNDKDKPPKSFTEDECRELVWETRGKLKHFIIRALGFPESFATRRDGLSQESRHETFSLVNCSIGDKIDIESLMTGELSREGGIHNRGADAPNTEPAVDAPGTGLGADARDTRPKEAANG